MRSFPSCWNKTLAQLGFKRKKKKYRGVEYARRRSLFETLEPRQMLAVDSFTVDIAGDVDDGNYTAGNLSLREALIQAATDSDLTTIDFAPGISDIVLGGTELTIDSKVTIDGPGVELLTIDGDNASRVFNVSSGVSAELNDLTITGGSSTSNGGGIYNSGDLTLDRVVVVDNHSGGSGGGLYSVEGSSVQIDASTFEANTAIHAGGARINTAGSGDSSVTNSTFVGNRAENGTTTSSGGALYVWGGTNSGTVKIVGSTFSGNSAETATGGLRAQNFALVEVINSTITNNSSASSSAGIGSWGSSSILMHNSIVVGNTSTADPTFSDADGAFDAASSYNLIGNTTSSALQDPNDNNQWGITEQQIALTALGNYAGPTWTHALQEGSLAIDMGSDMAAAEITTDQRGFARSVDISNINNDITNIVDIGAFEYSTAPLVVTTADDAGVASGKLSLRQAINLAALQPGPDEITFDTAVFNTPQTIVLATDVDGDGISDQLAIDSDVTITGPGADLLAIDAGGVANSIRAFHVTSTGSATISDLTVTGGYTTGYGGGLLADGDVTLNRTVWVDNYAGIQGGVIYASDVDVTITNSTFDNNASGQKGGALFYRNTGNSQLTVSSSTFSHNTGVYGNAIALNSTVATTTTPRIENTTISNNFGPVGGAVFVYGASDPNVVSVEIVNSTIAENTTEHGSHPAGLWVTHDTAVTIENSLLVGNVSGTEANNNEKLYDFHQNSHTVNGANNRLNHAAGGAADAFEVGQLLLTYEEVGLLPLDKYGGATATHALAAGSKVIDKGDVSKAVDSSGAPLVSDQRGSASIHAERIVGQNIDIGAFEYGAKPIGIGEPFLVNEDYTSNSQDDSWVATNSFGQTAVVWQGNGPEGYGIYAQIINALDDNTSVPRMVVGGPGVIVKLPKVTIDGAGNFAVIWNQHVGPSSNDYRIFMRRYNVDGTPVDLLPVDVGAAKSETTSIVSNDAGRLVVNWLDDNGDLMFRRYSTSGLSFDAAPRIGAASNELIIMTPASGRIAAIAEDGSFHLSWSTWENANGTGEDIGYLQKFTAGGVAEGERLSYANDTDGTILKPVIPEVPEENINSESAAQLRPWDIVVDNQGNVIVAWFRFEDFDVDDPDPNTTYTQWNERRVFLRWYRPDEGWSDVVEAGRGKKVTITGQLNHQDNLAATRPNLAVDDLGRVGITFERFVRVIENGTPTEEHTDIEVRWFESDGTSILKTNLAAEYFGQIATFAENPSLASDGLGGFLLTGTVNNDVYGRRYSLPQPITLEDDGTLLIRDLYSDIEEITVHSAVNNGRRVVAYNDLVTNILAEDVLGIRIEAGAGDNHIDLGRVDSAHFTNLGDGTIEVFGGAGNDVDIRLFVGRRNPWRSRRRPYLRQRGRRPTQRRRG